MQPTRRPASPTVRTLRPRPNLARAAACALLAAAALAPTAACSSTPDSSATGDTSAVTTSAVATTGLAVPAWAGSTVKTGYLPSSQKVSLQVHLQLRNVAAARAQLDAISDPDSAQYGQLLTTRQFASLYAPTATAVATVREHLEAHGLTVTDAPANNAYLTVSGTTAQVESAFSTRLSTYSVDGESRYAPEQTAKLPAAVSAQVATVLGLSTQRKATPRNLPGSDAASAAVTPDQTSTCSSYFDQKVTRDDPPFGDYVSPFPTFPCKGLVPSQVRHVYGLDVGTPSHPAGKGQTVAILDVTTLPTLAQDVDTYIKNNDPEYPLAAGQLTLDAGPGPVPTPDPDWFREEALDIEAIHAIAPGANIAFYAAASNDDSDLLAALYAIITRNEVTMISNSWGEIEAGDQAVFSAYENMALQAGLKGIGLYFASGDHGDNGTYNNGVATASFPNTLPQITSVGGSSLTVDAKGDRLFEVGWEASIASRATLDGGADAGLDAGAGDWTPAAPGTFFVGSGGGTSTVYVQPWWQKGIVPGALANLTGSPSRVIPDVAMMGDPFATGLNIGYSKNGTYIETFEGGTSLACPLFVATVALAQKQAGRRFGSANALLYKASRRGAFRDAAPLASHWAIDLAGATFLTGDLYTLDYAGPGNTLVSAKGFDNVTGLGVPAGQAFLDALEKH